VPLLRPRGDSAVGADGARVVEIAVEQRHADERDDSGRLRRDQFERRAGRADEARSQQEVLRWVTRHGELGEDDEVGARSARLRDALEDQLAVAVEVADDRVDLREREPHSGFSLTGENLWTPKPDRVPVVLEDLVDPPAE